MSSSSSVPRDDGTRRQVPSFLDSRHLLVSERDGGSREEASERTQLLPTTHNTSAQLVSEKNVHYRNIDGARFWWLFGSIIFGNTIAFFDSTLMASSHPVITSYFHASNSASWLSTAFYLTSTVFQPLYGRVSDTVGRRSVYLFAQLMFLLSTAWCALAQSIGSFIAARAMCGLGAGGVMAISSIVTSDIVKIEYRGIYQSYYNMAYGFGNGLGAAMGGLLCDRLGWRAAFGIQLPFIVIFILVTYFAIPRDLGPSLAKSQGKTILEALKSFDTLGAIGLTITVTSLILGINLGGNVLSWTHPIVITSLVVAIVGGITLSQIERFATRPILPFPLLTKPPLSNLMWASFLSSIATNTVIFNVPLFLQAVRQTTPTTSGLYLVSPLVGATITAVFAGYYITWTRRMKPMMVLGVLSLLIGSVATTSLTPAIPMWTLLLLIPGASIGQGFFFPATTIAVLALNTQDDQAVVTTTLGLLRSLGSIHGVALSSWILQNSLPVYLERTVKAKTPALKRQIILDVRKSVKAIANLTEPQRGQVRTAYAQALKVTFSGGIIAAVVVVALVLPIKLPRLQRQSDMDNDDLDNEDDNDDDTTTQRSPGSDQEEAAVTEEVISDESVSNEAEIPARDLLTTTLSRQTSRTHARAMETGRRASFDTSY